MNLLPLCLLSLLVSPLIAEQVGPWNLTELKTKVPAMHWLRRDQPVHSLIYTGEIYQSQDSEVFAFYASPSTLGMEVKPGAKFPGIVLIHGGGGTAFAEWAQLWAKRGYAAIAMDLAGSRPPDPTFDAKTGIPVGHQSEAKLRTRLPKGGPDQGHGEKFDCIGGDTSDDWPFHAAASVMRAHTLLRSFPEVDAERTAVTGISWGGYTTCLVASLDGRFKAAVPVYGCGFLHEGESVQKPSIDALGDRKLAWVKEYDPGSLLPRCHVPILFVNGSNDVHYPLDSYMKSYNAVPGVKQMRIQVNMPHGHPPGWAPSEIGTFIDSYCMKSTARLPLPGVPVVAGEQITCTCQGQSQLMKAELNYTADTGLRSKRQWTTVPATASPISVETIGGDMSMSVTFTAPKPPAGANTWFFTITDEHHAMVSSEVQFQPIQ